MADAPEGAAMSSQAEAAADGGDVERLLSVLPESQREVVLVLKVSGMSVEEIARDS